MNRVSKSSAVKRAAIVRSENDFDHVPTIQNITEQATKRKSVE
jgi:hypothetical protein